MTPPPFSGLAWYVSSFQGQGLQSAYAAITFPLSSPATWVDYLYLLRPLLLQGNFCSKVAKKCSTLSVVVSFCKVGFGGFFDESSILHSCSPLEPSSLAHGLPVAALSYLTASSAGFCTAPALFSAAPAASPVLQPVMSPRSLYLYLLPYWLALL